MMLRAYIVIPEVISTNPEIENAVMINFEIEKDIETACIEASLAATMKRSFYKVVTLLSL